MLACLVVGVVPPLTIGPFLELPRCAPSWARRYPSTALRSGTASRPAADERDRAGRRRRALSACCANISAQLEGRRCSAHLKGQRIFERVLVRCPGGWRRRWRASSAPGGCSHSCGCSIVAAARRRLRRSTLGRSLSGDRIERQIDPAFALMWAVGVACALGAAYRPSFIAWLRSSCSAARGSSPASLRLALRAGSRVDAAGGRDRDHGAASARVALAPQAHRADGPATPRARIRWYRVRDLIIAALRARPGGDRLCGDDAAAARKHLAVLRRERLPGGRRHQRRQRHPGGFPRLRHLGRDHRARRRGAHRVRAVAPIPAGAREHRVAGAAANPGRLKTGIRSRHGDTRQRPGVPAFIMRLLFPVIVLVAHLYACCAATTCRAGDSWPGSRWRSRFILQYMAAGTRWVEARLHVLPGPLDRRIGLLLAAATGAGAWLSAVPSSTSYFSLCRICR